MNFQTSYNIHNCEGNVKWSSPSNIALVKYWGKKGDQIPANPSLSFTLNNCKTTTEVKYQVSLERKELEFAFYFEGKERKSFEPKLHKFFERITPYVPYLKHSKLEIHSENSFPHSSGIASSASAMSALSICLIDIEKTFLGLDENSFLQKASFLSRLGSGSACRSIYPTLASWGVHNSFNESSDEYATPFTGFNEVFSSYQDTVLLVDKGEKKVSSTVGHNLMINHPYANRRFEQAHENLLDLKQILEGEDLNRFISLVESEALTLHAMMMTSKEYYLLFMPNTIEIIHRIMNFREQNNIPVCFTLDAGANVHVLYPKAYQQQVMDLITKDLVVYCQNGEYICDEVGSGPIKLI